MFFQSAKFIVEINDEIINAIEFDLTLLEVKVVYFILDLFVFVRCNDTRSLRYEPNQCWRVFNLGSLRLDAVALLGFIFIHAQFIRTVMALALAKGVIHIV